MQKNPPVTTYTAPLVQELNGGKASGYSQYHCLATGTPSTIAYLDNRPYAVLCGIRTTPTSDKAYYELANQLQKIT